MNEPYERLNKLLEFFEEDVETVGRLPTEGDGYELVDVSDKLRELVAWVREMRTYAQDNATAMIDQSAELKAYREREPLVKALIETCLDHDKQYQDIQLATEAVDRFKIGGE